MKKFLAIVLTLATFLPLVACTSDGTNGATTAEVEALISEMRTSLVTLIEEGEATLATFKAKYEAEKADLAKKDAENKAAIEALTAAYEAKVAELVAADKANADALTAAKAELTEQVAALTAADAENKKAIEDLTAAYEAKVAELVAADKANADALTAAKAELAEDILALTEANADAAEAITALTAVYEAKVAELVAADKTNADALAAAKAELAEDILALTEANADAAEAITALTAAYEAKVAELMAADKTNADALTAAKAELEAAIEALTKTEEDGEENNGEEDNGDALADFIAIYEAKVAELMAADKANADALAAAKAELEAAIEALTKTEEDGEENNGEEDNGEEDNGEEDNGDALADFIAIYEAKVAELVAADKANSDALAAAKAEFTEQVAALTAADAENKKAIEDLTAAYEAKVAALVTADRANSALIASAKSEFKASLSELEGEITEVAADVAALDSEYEARIAALEEKKETLNEIDATLTKAGVAADSKAVGDALALVSESLNAIKSILETKPIMDYVYKNVDVTSAEYENRKSHYLDTNGDAHAHSTYAYTEFFDVLPGDVVHLTGYYPTMPESSSNYTNKHSIRMVCVYGADGKTIKHDGQSPGGGMNTYTIPAGGVKIAVTYTMTHFKPTIANPYLPVFARYTACGESFVISDKANSDTVLKAVADITVMAAKIEAIEKDVANLDSESINALSDSIVSLTAKIDALDLDKLNASIESIKNLNTNDLNMMVSAVFGSTSIIGTADKLVPGSKLSLENNTVINNKNLTFTCDIPEGGLVDGALIRVGHGKTNYGGSYIEINKTNIVQYSYGSGPSIVVTTPHSLNIKDYLTVVIDSDYGSASIRVITSTGSYSYSKSWQGRNGDIFAEVEGVEITNVKMRWFCEDYSKPVWMFGDSYFSSTDKSRWTSYLIESGYKNFMMCSYSGMPTERGLTEFKTALNHGTPKYAVWCMGMNNGDSGTTVNAKYLAATEEFLEICEEKGITPILSTIPSTPTVLNEPKNAWVRNWAKTTGGRYIDFARAVSDQTYNESLKGKVVANTSSASDKTNTTGYQWYDGMLHSDAVHPATTGAYALFMQFLVDFPEIMQENY